MTEKSVDDDYDEERRLPENEFGLDETRINTGSDFQVKKQSNPYKKPKVN